MSREARVEYEQAVLALDRILYEEALEHLQATIQLDPENVRLRFMAVQLATYLGDTRWGEDSLTYYGIAIDNLRRMASSPQLNLREQQRAQDAIERLITLQQTVLDRDQSRRQWGWQLAQIIAARDGRKSKEEEDTEAAAERLALIQQYAQEFREGSDGDNGFGPSVLAPATPATTTPVQPAPVQQPAEQPGALPAQQPQPQAPVDQPLDFGGPLPGAGDITVQPGIGDVISADEPATPTLDELPELPPLDAAPAQ